MTLHDELGPASSRSKTARVHKASLWAGTALVGSLGVAFITSAQALPVGGAVVAGSATFGSTPTTLAVKQSSQNVVIDWQSFSIASGESVVFAQPNSSSVALNRVVGADPSAIFGSLTANGNIFLVNPSGVLFGKGAQVNVGGLVASTQDITNANFMAGAYRFDGASSGSVSNQGTIAATGGGYIALLGASVSNTGVITAKLGSVVLAAGEAMTLDVAGDGLLNITVSRGALGALAQNGGLIQANGGQVIMTAQSAGVLIRGAVNNTGVIEAMTVGSRGGVIALLGDADNTTVSVSGTLDASGLAPGESGGQIAVTGQHVGLFAASLTTSGDAGGGSVRIGGGLHGQDASLVDASATYVSADSTIAANAVGAGSGGQVVVWSNLSTRAYGAISSRGGAESGDGGLIETSGHWLDVTGAAIDAAAPSGKAGTWLLDPADVTIGSNTSNGSFSGGNPDIFTPDPNASISTVNGATIEADLNAGTNVLITSANPNGAGQGDITVASGLTWTAVGVPTTLTLNAVRDVDIGAAITATNGSLVVIAGRDVNQNAAVSTTGGGFTATSQNNVNLNAAVTAVNGTVTANAAKNVNAAAALTVTNGNIMLVADTDGTGPGVAGGTVTFSGAGTATLNNGVATIIYNPVAYGSPNNYAPFFSGNGTLNPLMLVFPIGGNKIYDGTTVATVGLKGAPPVTLTVANPQFDTKNVGDGKPITFDSSTLSLPGYVLYTPLGSPPGGPGVTTGNITPAPLIVTAADVTKPYGTTPALNGFTTAGLVSGDTIASVTETSPGQAPTAGVGGSPYAITPSAATGGTFAPSNYAITYVNGVLTVTAIPLTITASNVTKVYGATPALTAFTTTGLVNGDTVSSVTETSPGQGASAGVAGSPYAITPGGAVGTYTPANYVVSYTAGGLSVTPAALSVMASDASKLYGSDYTPTAFTTTGLVNGDTIGMVVETSPGDSASASYLGSPYPITASGASGGSYIASNYVTSYTGGSLTVLPTSPGSGGGGGGGSGGGSSGTTSPGDTGSGLAGPSQGTGALIGSTTDVADVSFDSNHIDNNLGAGGGSQPVAVAGVLIAVLGAGVNIPAAAIQQADVGSQSTAAANGSGVQYSATPLDTASANAATATGTGTGVGEGHPAIGAGHPVVAARPRKQDRH